jgi:hypothetical protein
MDEQFEIGRLLERKVRGFGTLILPTTVAARRLISASEDA